MIGECPDICKSCVRTAQDLPCMLREMDFRPSPSSAEAVEKLRKGECIWYSKAPDYDVNEIMFKRQDRTCPICGKGWLGAYVSDFIPPA